MVRFTHGRTDLFVAAAPLGQQHACLLPLLVLWQTSPVEGRGQRWWANGEGRGPALCKMDIGMIDFELRIL